MMRVNLVLTGGVLQVGDVGTVTPYSRSFASGGSRGAASFVTEARHIHSATRLHFADQSDCETFDSNLIGKGVPDPLACEPLDPV